MNYLDPFSYLGTTAGKVIADGWTALMLGLWNAGLWLLRLALSVLDSLLTPDLSADGPGSGAYRVSLWLALALVLVMALLQLGLAVIRRDGRVLARAAVGLAQYIVIWAGWLGYGITVVAGASGLTHALMDSLLGVSAFAAWQPWQPFTPADITDGTIATVLGVMGLFLILAAVGHLLAMLARAASLIVLAATTPIASAGLVSDLGRSWFFKSLRWFHAAALSPVLMVLVLGVGTQFASGVATGLTGNKLDAVIGSAVPGVLLICVAAVSPMALFRLLSFVDPGTTSGAGMRASLDAAGGLQGLLNPASRQSSSAKTANSQAATAESSGEQATTQRFAATAGTAMGLLGPAGQAAGAVLGVVSRVGGAAATMGADLTNQMGVGHNVFPPDYSHNAKRATADAHRQTTPPGGSAPPGAPGAAFPSTGPAPTAPSPGPGVAGASAEAAPAGGEAAAAAAI